MAEKKDKLVKGNARNGITFNGGQYFVIIDGDKLNTSSNDLSAAEDMFKDFTGVEV